MIVESIVYALFGWLVGVAINYAADVLPEYGQRGAFPLCRMCKSPRRRLAWSGLLAYVSGRSDCQNCGAPLPLRMVLVELVTPVIFVGLLCRYGMSVHLGLMCVYSTVLILVTVTDLEHHLIQHVVMVPAILMAIGGAFFNADISAAQALLGGATGLVIMFSLYLLAVPFSKLLARRSGREITEVPFGFGDVTMGTFVGLITGLPGVFLALLITIFSAGLGALVIIVVRFVFQKRYKMFTTIPYGPFLALGGFVMMVYGPQILEWYLGT